MLFEPEFRFTLPHYLGSKINQNIGIVGSAGCGKSYLMRCALDTMDEFVLPVESGGKITGFNHHGVLDEETERIFQLDSTLLVGLMTRAGWGLLSFTADQDSGTQGSFIVKNCAFFNEKDSYPCDFLRGLILGLTTKMYDRRSISSTSCTTDADGRHICRIKLISK